MVLSGPLQGRTDDLDVIPAVRTHTFCWSTDGGLVQKDTLGHAADECRWASYRQT